MKPRHLLPVLALSLTSFLHAQEVKHNYDLQDVNWSISFDEKTYTINGDVTNTLQAKEATPTIDLHSGKLQISTVTVNDKSAKWTQSGEVLTVALPQPAAANDTLKIRIVYSGKPEAGVYFTTGQRTFPAHTPVVYTQGEAEDTRYWLPTYDKPDDKATSEGHITVPKGYLTVSNGALVDVQHGNGTDTYHWKIGLPHSTYLISWLAGPYEKGHEAWDGIPVDWYVPTGLKEMGEAAFGGTAEKVGFYSKLTGFRYPYEKFAQSAVGDFPFGGMENITAVTQTIGALLHPYDLPTRDASGLVLHELAHQWFGDTVTCPDWSHIWINEGWASFLPHFWFRAHRGEDAYQIQRYGTMMGAWGSMNGSTKPMVSAKYNVPMDNFDGNAYGGGAARMFMLMAMLGEDTFWKSVTAYLNEYKFKNVSTEDFFRSFSASSGKDLDLFRKQWYYTAAVPAITASIEGHSLKLTQKEPAFAMDVDVWFWTGNAWEKRKVVLTGTEATLDLGPLAIQPYLVDPQVNWVATVTYKQPPSAKDLNLLYAHAPNAGQKLRLIALAKELHYSEVLSVIAMRESSDEIKASALKDLVSPTQTDMLLKFTGDRDLRIVQAAAEQLGEGKSSPEVVSRLQQLWDLKNTNVRVAALNSLLKLTKDEALAQRAYATDSTQDAIREAVLRWYVANNPDKGRTMALAAVNGTGASAILRNAAIGMLGGLKDSAGSTTVRTTLEGILTQQGHQPKLSAISALQTYGDPASIPALEKLSDYSMYQVRTAAIAAVTALKAKK